MLRILFVFSALLLFCRCSMVLSDIEPNHPIVVVPSRLANRESQKVAVFTGDPHYPARSEPKPFFFYLSRSDSSSLCAKGGQFCGIICPLHSLLTRRANYGQIISNFLSTSPCSSVGLKWSRKEYLEQLKLDFMFLFL